MTPKTDIFIEKITQGRTSPKRREKRYMIVEKITPTRKHLHNAAAARSNHIKEMTQNSMFRPPPGNSMISSVAERKYLHKKKNLAEEYLPGNMIGGGGIFIKEPKQKISEI
ncbi:hypothetical protein C922_05181 [Plasmodium inui San Antonio 1]|uniref:Uncharacterized protein n=1 Tax=Plasmodium inui San Antonio 1 TaxID=1237626 RepID=W6ZU16_9APIC|nr:hypothetical protein C922_05181 [Plasmodium inui San Antonio 1]EUD64437.1 hypothetical protein C922_05181 [Plasmodium inui San Antonio 1]